MTETLQTAYNVLCAVYEDGVLSPALQFARAATVLSGSVDAPNGHYFGGAIFGTFTRDLGSTTQPGVITPEMKITIHRNIENQAGATPDVVAQIIAAKLYDRATIRVWRSFDDSTQTLIFVGYIGRGDVEITRDAVTIQARDRVRNDDRVITGDTMPETSSDTWRGKPIPLLIGDWSDIQSDYMIESPVLYPENNGAAIRCNLSLSGEFGVEQLPTFAHWYASGANLKGDFDQPPLACSAASALFPSRFDVDDSFLVVWGDTLNSAGIVDDWTAPVGTEGDWLYFRDGDTMRIKGAKGIRGRRIDSSSAVTENVFVEHPVDVIFSLMRDSQIGLDIAETAIDIASFWSAKSRLGTSAKCRAYVRDTDKPIIDLIARLAMESNMKLVVEAATYYIVWIGYRDGLMTQTTNTIYGRQVLDWNMSGESSRETFEAVRVEYRFDPSKNETRLHRDIGPFDDTPTDRSYTLTSDWFYEGTTISTIVGIWGVNHVADLMRARVTCDFSTTGYSLGDYVRVIHDDLNGYWQIVRIDDNLTGANVVMELLAFEQGGNLGWWVDDVDEALPDFLGGGDVPANWAAATTAQKERLSFWYADDGLDPNGDDGREWSN